MTIQILGKWGMISDETIPFASLGMKSVGNSSKDSSDKFISA
jgi:hypothetical protein